MQTKWGHKALTTIITFALTLVLIVAIPLTASATTESVTYLDASGTIQAVTATVIDASNISTIDNLNGWYIVRGTLNRSTTLTVDGTAHLILENDSHFTITGSWLNAGINVSGNNSILLRFSKFVHEIF